MGLKFLEKNCKDIGIVEAIGDGIGLTNVANGEMIQEEGLVLSSDDVIRKFQLMSLPPIHTSVFIIGDYKTAIAGNGIQYVPKTGHILKKPLKTVMEVSTMNKNGNPNFDNLYISKLCTSKYFDDVIKSQQLFEMFHQGKKVEAINKYMLENNEELIAQNREIIKNMQIQDE